jgi:hypothetical protein
LARRLGDGARQGVNGGASRKWHDQGDRAGGPLLRGDAMTSCESNREAEEADR